MLLGCSWVLLGVSGILERLRTLAVGDEYPPGWERGQGDAEANVSFKKRSLRSSMPTWYR